MSEKVRITHEGVITAIGDTSIQVEIVDKSACAECHAKGVCSASDEKIKTVDVPLTIGNMSARYEVGEKVLVTMASSLGFTAVIYAYGVPLVLLLLAMLTASLCGLSELYVGLTGIAAVVLYYIGLAFFSKKLTRVFTFSIQKLQ